MNGEFIFVDLDHDDVMKLVTTSMPEPDKIPAYINKGYAYYGGKYDEEFMWMCSVLKYMDIEDLYRMYLDMKFDKPLRL